MNQRTVFVSGIFNILHPGHLRLLRFAKESGDRLIVGVESDKAVGNLSHINERLRLDGVQSNSYVDDAFIIEGPVIDVLKIIQPQVVVKGREHEDRFNPEAEVIKSYGGKLIFCSGETTFSSLDLIRKEFKKIDSGSILLPDEFMIRHGILANRLSGILKSFKDLKICVIGDLIVDEYITCQPLGISQEDPAIVVTPLDSSKFLGGAGIVAAHGAGLGAVVEFFSVVGADEAGEYSRKELQSAGVDACIFVDEGRPTTLKQRYRSNGKSLFRVSHLHQNSISIDLQEKILTALKKSLSDSDVLIFSDFNYGCLPQRLVDQIIEIAKNSKVLIAADSQSSSQIGDICRFKGLDLITPTEREARVAARNREDGLVILAEQVQKHSGAKIVFLKLGAEGLLIHRDADEKDSLITDRIGSLNCAPKDVAGAGDSMLIISALTLAKGGTVWEAAMLGSLAAAVQVSRVGNTPLNLEDLLKELNL